MSSQIPSQNPSRPICRDYINSKCNRGKKCRFYHPKKITKMEKLKANRRLGYCYCGSPHQKIINKKIYREGEDVETPIFFVICSRTKKSTKYCINLND